MIRKARALWVVDIVVQLDDRVVHDPTGFVVVASLDLRMGGVCCRDTFSGLERATRRSVPYHISSRCSHEFRSFWKFMVCLQSGRNGLVGTSDSSIPRVARLKRNCSIWYGVQASIGGTCVLVMLRAMWPSVNTIRE